MTVSASTYLWIKTVHVIAVFAWWAGLIYIFRLFVYHRKHAASPELARAYSEMEEKLLRIITTPAGIVSAAAGFGMILAMPALLQGAWLWVKIGAVTGLAGYHVLSVVTYRRFAAGNYFLSEKACRAINEVPTLLLFVIVIMVIRKPWL